MKIRNLFPRLAAGAFILEQGLSKQGLEPAGAEGLHGMATGAYPALKDLDPQTFIKMLSSSEIVLGALLLTPFIPKALAGGALAGFASGLIGLYLRTPGTREEGSLRPTQQGLPLAKDVWLLAMGLGLVAEALTEDD